MTKQWTRLERLVAAALFVLGCGGSTEPEEAPEETSLPEQSEQQPSGHAPVPDTLRWSTIDEVPWKNEIISFYEVPIAPGEFAVVVQQTSSPETGIDLYQRLRMGSELPVTPAELWIHATGLLEVPEKLALDHERTAREWQRPVSYQQTKEGVASPPSTVEKAISTAAFIAQHFPAAPTTCWQNLRTQRTTANPPTSFYTCARRTADPFGNMLRGGDYGQSSSCNDSFETATATWRIAVFGEATGAMTPAKTQFCSGQKSGSTSTWTCGVVSSLPMSTGRVYDSTVNVNGRAAVGVGNPADTADRAYTYTMGRAHLRVFPPGPDGRTCPF